jgi:hypothetical protein
MSDVGAANWFTRYALLEDGRSVPIVQLFDCDGDETNDPDEAISFVAGEGNEWYTGLCSDFAEVPHQ